MFISKQTIAVSSNTATWSLAKRAAIGRDMNGALLDVHITDGASTNVGIKLYRGTTDTGNLVLRLSAPTSANTWRPRRKLTIDSTVGGFNYGSTDEARVPWVFADQAPIVCMGATGKSFTLTLYVEGTVSPA